MSRKNKTLTLSLVLLMVFTLLPFSSRKVHALDFGSTMSSCGSTLRGSKHNTLEKLKDYGKKRAEKREKILNAVPRLLDVTRKNIDGYTGLNDKVNKSVSTVGRVVERVVPRTEFKPEYQPPGRLIDQSINDSDRARYNSAKDIVTNAKASLSGSKTEANARYHICSMIINGQVPDLAVQVRKHYIQSRLDNTHLRLSLYKAVREYTNGMYEYQSLSVENFDSDGKINTAIKSVPEPSAIQAELDRISSSAGSDVKKQSAEIRDQTISIRNSVRVSKEQLKKELKQKQKYHIPLELNQSELADENEPDTPDNEDESEEESSFIPSFLIAKAEAYSSCRSTRCKIKSTNRSFKGMLEQDGINNWWYGPGHSRAHLVANKLDMRPKKFGGQWGPWCAYYATKVWRVLGVDIPEYWSVSQIREWGKNNGQWRGTKYSPSSGDMVIFAQDSHVAFIDTKKKDGRVKIIGGNVGPNGRGGIYYQKSIYGKTLDYPSNFTASGNHVSGYVRPPKTR